MAVSPAAVRAFRTATTYDLDRLRSFSDCVFAVAITVLVLSLRLPLPTDAGDLGAHLAAEWDRYVSYLAGFAVIGYFWVSHHRTFELIIRADITLARLNLFFLYFVVFLPFPIAVLSEYWEQPAGVFLFDLVVLLVGVTNAAIWQHATRGNRLVSRSLSAGALRLYRLRSLVLPAVFALSLVLTQVSVALAIASWALVLAGRPLLRATVGGVPSGETDAEEDETDETDETDGAAAAQAGESARTRRARESRARLLSFSDNVYAFAITLLVLRFSMPKHPDDITTNAELVSFLSSTMTKDLVPYTVAFFTISLFWDFHHRTGLLIQRQDGTLRIMNLVHLMVIALIPLAAELQSRFSDTGTALCVFAAVAGTAGLTLAVENWWITGGHRLCDPDLPTGWIDLRIRTAAIVPAAFYASAVLAPWLGAVVQVLWFVPFVVTRLVMRNWERAHIGPAIRAG